MSGKDYILTVIIPNRNLTGLLERCLRSVPRREDIQIIVVDDASDPDVLASGPYPGSDDPSVETIFSSERRGAGHARNLGLERAEGKWLMFLDSDDFLLPGALELIDRYTSSDSDIVFFNIESAFSDSLKPAWRQERFRQAFERYQADGGQLDAFLRYGYTEPWGKLIRRSLVADNGISFEESPVANDYRFSVMIGYYAEKIELCLQPLLCVTVREGSLSNDYFGDAANVLARVRVYAGIQRFYDEKGIALEPLFRLLRGVRGKRKDIFAEAMDLAASMGYGRLSVLYRCFIGYFRSRCRPSGRFI